MTTNDLIISENKNREEIILNKDKRNIIISAGAGAGKTEMLSKSILTRLINDPDLDPSQVVAITFTNAATEELKTRLYDKYEELVKDAEKKGEKIREINIDDIFVSTIHSFCSSLVTQMSFECGLGISPEFEESTDLSESKDVEVFIRNYIREHEEFDKLKEYNGYYTYKTIKDKFTELAKNPELELIIESDADKPADDDLKCLAPISDNIERIALIISSCELAQMLKSVASDGIDNRNSLENIIILIRRYFTIIAKEKSNKVYAIVKNAFELLKKEGITKDTIKGREKECLSLLNDTLNQLSVISKEKISDGLTYFMKSNYRDLLNAVDALVNVIKEGKPILTKLKAVAITRIINPFEGEKSIANESYPYSNSKRIIPDYEPEDEDKIFFAEFADIFEKLLYKDVNGLKMVFDEYYKKLMAEYIKGMYEGFVKLERMTINSNDLLVLSKKLLYGKNKRAVRKYFKNKYKVFYVDEFQDTDYLQLKMILALTGNDDNGGLEDGKLFLVGDPKQSIYRFRGAEVAFYKYMKEKVFKADEFHDLELNYRSDKSIVNWINNTYKKKFEGGSIDYSNMIPVKNCSGIEEGLADTASDGSKTPEMLQPLKEESGKLPLGVFEEKADKLTADLIADRAKSLLGKRITVFDKEIKQNVEKTVEPEDIMIITKTKKWATEIYNALKDRNIPVTVSGKILPAEKRTMRRLKALMRYIESGTRLRTAEVAAAFSPLSGLKSDGGYSGNGIITDSYSLNQAQRLFDILKTSKEIYYSKGAMAVIYNAINKGYFLDSYMNDMTLNDEMPMLSQFVEMLSVECYDNIGAINEYISEFMEKELKNVLSQSKNRRYVRVMNLHQTKGLEANIVINVIVASRDPSDKFLFEYYSEDNQAQTFNVYDVPKCYMVLSKEHNEIRQQLRSNEAIRRDYVRDTRAEYIMLFLSEKNKKNDQSDSAPANNDYGVKMIEPTAASVFSIYPRDKTCTDFDSCYISPSPSSLEKDKKRDDPKAERTGTVITLGKESTDDLSYKAGAIRGTVMHRAFELYLLSRNLPEEITENTFSCFAKQALIESMGDIDSVGANEEEINTLYESIVNDVRVFSNWFESSPYASCKTAMETPFFMVIDKKSLHDFDKDICRLIEDNRKADMTKVSKNIPSEKIFFSGFSDLICIDSDDSLIVIDYKSDEAGYYEETMLEKYKPQQLAYYYAFSSILKQYKPKSREQILYTPHAFKGKLLIKGKI